MQFRAILNENIYCKSEPSGDYYFSSARNYAGLDNDLEVILLDLLRQFG
jgi:hypothetical protein